MDLTRPPRTAAHVERDRLIAQFKDAGLVPVLSTNGGIPDADIQIVKGPKPGEVLEVWVTARGDDRLVEARAQSMRKGGFPDESDMARG